MPIFRILIPALFLLALPTPAAEFAADRIGAGRPDSLPLVLEYPVGQMRYKFQLLGKDDLVSVMLTGGAKPCSILLLPSDQNTLALQSLQDTRIPPESSAGVALLCQFKRNAPPEHLVLATAHPAILLLKRWIDISRMPVYVVVRGDTLERILLDRLGGKYTQEALLKVNPGLDPDVLVPGQEIRIPQTGAPHAAEETPPAAPPATKSDRKKPAPAPAGDQKGESQ